MCIRDSRTEAERDADEDEGARRAALESDDDDDDDDDAPRAPPPPIVRGPPPPRKVKETRETYQVEDEIEARFERGSQWYRGRVIEVNPFDAHSYRILYEDGDKESNVRPEFMRRISAPPVPRAQAPAAEAAPPPPRAQEFSPGVTVDAAAAAFGPQYVEAARNGGPEKFRGTIVEGETIEGFVNVRYDDDDDGEPYLTAVSYTHLTLPTILLV